MSRLHSNQWEGVALLAWSPQRGDQRSKAFAASILDAIGTDASFITCSRKARGSLNAVAGANAGGDSDVEESEAVAAGTGSCLPS